MGTTPSPRIRAKKWQQMVEQCQIERQGISIIFELNMASSFFWVIRGYDMPYLEMY